MAEAIMNRVGAPRFMAFSAGSAPRGQVDPRALGILVSNGFRAEDFRPKSWDEMLGANAPRFDFVFTLCETIAAGPQPIWPGHPMCAYWGVPDPVAVNGAPAEVGLAFADTFRMLRNRIELFVNLPMSSLDRLSLQNRLDAIGKAAPARATAG